MAVVEVTGGEFKVFEEDILYTATIKSYELQPEQPGAKYSGDQYKWVLEVVDHLDGGETSEFWFWTKTKLVEDERSKLRQLVFGATGLAPVRGERFDLDDLIGKQVRLMFEGTDKSKVSKIRRAAA